MRRILEFKAGSGGIVRVETAEEATSGYVEAGAARELASKASETFESALATVKGATQTLVDTFSGITHADSFDVEFAVKFSATAGAVIASTTSEVNFKVTLRWKKPERD